VLYSHRICA